MGVPSHSGACLYVPRPPRKQARPGQNHTTGMRLPTHALADYSSVIGSGG